MGRIWLGTVLTLLSALGMAATSSEAAAGGVGKMIGMALFGFIVMKIMNRKKKDHDDEDENQSVTPSHSNTNGSMSLIKVGLMLIVGLFLLTKLLP